MSILIDNGANVTLENNEGHTPLDLASLQSFADIVAFLKANGGLCNTTCPSCSGLEELNDDRTECVCNSPHMEEDGACKHTAESCPGAATPDEDDGTTCECKHPNIGTPADCRIPDSNCSGAATVNDAGTECECKTPNEGTPDNCRIPDSSCSGAAAVNTAGTNCECNSPNRGTVADCVAPPASSCATLLQAAEADDLSCAKYYVYGGADVDQLHAVGMRTPLHFAAANNSVAMAELLLDNGANIDAQNQGGFTPLDIAFSQFNASVEAFLKGRGATCNAHSC